MTTLSDLLAVPTKDDTLDTLVGVAQLGGFPTASWQPGSVARTLYEGEALVLSDLASAIALVARGGFLDLAEAGWLDLLAANLFQLTRKAAVHAQHTVRLTAGAGVGPNTITAGDYWVATADRALRFVATTGGTLPLAGTLDITVQAETAGATYNVTPGRIVEQVTPFPGVTVTNPGGTSGTSLVVQGTDAETDEALRQRARDKWATIGSGSNIEAYRYWATTASSEVTRTGIVADPTTGVVSVVIAGPSGPVTAAALALVDAEVQAKRPIAVMANVVNATPVTISVVATLRLAPGAGATAVRAAAQAAVDAYVRTTALGGTVYRSRIIDALHVSGVSHVETAMLLPATDIALPGDGVFVPVYSLTAIP
jgi:phage-related baseplate assembly protein